MLIENSIVQVLVELHGESSHEPPMNTPRSSSGGAYYVSLIEQAFRPKSQYFVKPTRANGSNHRYKYINHQQ